VIELQLPAAGNGIFAAGDTEPVSNLSQEREFSVQRQGDKISDFGTYSTAETAQTKKPGTHVFDNSDVLRASLSHHNYREWVVGTTGIEPVTPTMSTQCVDGNYNGNREKRASNVRLRSRLGHGNLGHFLGREALHRAPDPEMQSGSFGSGTPKSQRQIQSRTGYTESALALEPSHG
jgi:hypothetical protein